MGAMASSLKHIFLAFGLAFALFFTGLTIFNHVRPASAYTTSNPAYAAVDPAYASPGITDWWNSIKAWADNFWEDVHCATNVHCWIKASSDSIASHGIDIGIGTDLEKLRAANSMREAFPNGFGLAGSMGSLIAGVYSNPADIHLATFFKDKLANNLLVSPAYATKGTEFLDPIYEAWEVFRNIAYAFFVVIVGAIAMMIMLRKQLEPRMVVTVTHALPRMFMALILITLSYPIAALFVDILAFWLPAVLVKELGFQNAFEALVSAVGGIAGASSVTATLVGGSALAIVVATALAIGTLPGVGLALLVPLLLVVIAGLIVMGAILVQILYRYSRLLVMTVLGPLILLLGALPGQEGAIANWFKDLAVNALVFTAILFSFFLSATIMTSALVGGGAAGGTIRSIPGMPGAIGALADNLVLPLAALTVLLMSFKMPGIIENAIKGRGRR